MCIQLYSEMATAWSFTIFKFHMFNSNFVNFEHVTALGGGGEGQLKFSDCLLVSGRGRH